MILFLTADRKNVLAFKSFKYHESDYLSLCDGLANRQRGTRLCPVEAGIGYLFIK